MVVGAALVNVHLAGCRSLKEKRRRLKGVMERLKARFNVSVGEVDDQDVWQRATIGVAVTGDSEFGCRRVLHQVEKFVETQGELRVTGFLVSFHHPE